MACLDCTANLGHTRDDIAQPLHGAQFYEKKLKMVNLIDDPDCPNVGRHHELEKAEVKNGEEAIQHILTAVRNFTNPFTIVDKDKVYSLASSAAIPMDVEMDVR